jgi:hypothetical protein
MTGFVLKLYHCQQDLVICCPGAEGLVLEYLHPETLNISFGVSTN